MSASPFSDDPLARPAGGASSPTVLAPAPAEVSPGGRQTEEAKHIGDRGSILPYAARDFFLSHSKIDDKPFISLSFFYGVEVFPLKVFN